MIYNERQQEIIRYLKEHGKITSREIQTKYEVSFDTARRDLRILEKKGLLKRIHGGAISLSRKDDPPEILSSLSTDSKINYQIKAITSKAAAIIENNDVIFINEPLFSDQLIRELDKNINITVVTNSIIVAEQFRNMNNVQLFIRGGLIDSSGTCMDIFTIDIIKKMHFDKSFITSTNISSKFGLSMQTNRSISLINAIIESSKETIGLYPSERVGFESLLNICPVNKLNVIITNHDAPKNEIESFNNQGVKIILADEASD